MLVLQSILVQLSTNVTYYYHNISTPIGELYLVATATHLIAVLWKEEWEGKNPSWMIIKDQHHPLLQETATQLKSYFQQQRKIFDLPIQLAGTSFQNKVWQALQKIPYGKTSSYKAIASAIGSPNASRAVGAANGQNPIPIIIPCHRIIGVSNRLIGYSGGLERKAYLLNLEKSIKEPYLFG